MKCPILHVITYICCEFSVGSVAPAFTGKSPSIKTWSQHFNNKSSIQLKSGKKFRHPTL